MTFLCVMILANTSDIQNCLSYFSTAVIKYPQGNLQNHLILDLGFRRLRVDDDSSKAGRAETLLQRERDVEWGETLETFNPVPRETPPPTRPHLLSLPKQFHHLGTQYSNM